MSMWQSNLGQKARHLKKYTKFPEAFPYPKDVRALACGPSHIIKVDLAIYFVAKFIYDNIYPTTKHLIKQALTGDYACGIQAEFEEPKEVLPLYESNDGLSYIIEIPGPLVEAAMYLWMADTVFGALQTAHSLWLKFENCDDDPNAAIMADGSANLPSNVQDGSPAFFTTVFDPMNACDPTPGDIRYQSGSVTVDVFGKVTNTGSVITQLSVSLRTSQGVVSTQSISPPSIGASSSWHVGINFHAISDGACQPVFSIIQSGQGPFSVNILCSRFILHQSGAPIPPNVDNYPNFPNSCMAAHMPPLVMPG